MPRIEVPHGGGEASGPSGNVHDVNILDKIPIETVTVWVYVPAAIVRNRLRIEVSLY